MFTHEKLSANGQSVKTKNTLWTQNDSIIDTDRSILCNFLYKFSLYSKKWIIFIKNGSVPKAFVGTHYLNTILSCVIQDVWPPYKSHVLFL